MVKMSQEIKPVKLTSRIFDHYSLDRLLGKQQALEELVKKQAKVIEILKNDIAKADEAFKKCLLEEDFNISLKKAIERLNP